MSNEEKLLAAAVEGGEKEEQQEEVEKSPEEQLNDLKMKYYTPYDREKEKIGYTD